MHFHFVGFKVLMVMTVKYGVFWVVIPCSSGRAQHFGGTYCLNLWGQRAS